MKDLKIKQTFRSIMLFENISGKPFEIKNTTDQFLYFYCILLACNPDQFSKTFDEFIDYLDENPEFITYISKEIQKQEKINSQFNNSPDSVPPSGRKKKL